SAQNQTNADTQTVIQSKDRDARQVDSRSQIGRESVPDGEPFVGSPAAAPRVAANQAPAPTEIVPESRPAVTGPPRDPSIVRILSLVALAGSLLFSLRMLGAALLLRRRQAICRPVTDAAVLSALESASRQAGVRRHPGLLVTPEAISPCIVGTWNPRIIVPE